MKLDAFPLKDPNSNTLPIANITVPPININKSWLKFGVYFTGFINELIERINRILKSIFYKQHSIAQKQGSVISVHSLRKTAGTYVYNNKGLEVARSFLQHENYDMTKKYLEIDKMELIDIKKLINQNIIIL